jgi:serpin B
MKLILIFIVFMSSNLLANRLNYSIKDNNELAKANNEFAFKLFNELDDPKEKVTVFSPLSISSAMAMAGSGAAGDTENQILDLLSIEGSQLLGGPYGSYLSSMNYTQPKLSIANALVLKDFNKVYQTYQDTIKLDYGGEVFEGDLDSINKWASEKTQGKIPKILDTLQEDFICVLLNAVYFKGDWARPFEIEDTRDMSFSVSKSDTVKVPTMNQTDDFSMLDPLETGGSYSVISLPYKGGKASMVVVLPTGNGSVKDVADHILEIGFGSLWEKIGQSPTQEVRLSLPKFKIKGDYDLVPPFMSLGLKDAFGVNADFSKISRDQLVIDQIKHKAIVEVDETGTVAAAVTAVAMLAAGMPQEPLSFIVDRPFLFFLVDNETGTILFLGRVSDPRG